MPVLLITGSTPIPLDSAFSVIPKVFGIEGPVTSASRIAVLYPRRCIAAARSDVTSDLPTPPFPLTTPITFFTFESSFCGTRKLSLLSVLDEQFAVQLPQS